MLAIIFLLVGVASLAVPSSAELVSGFRPPAIPLFAFSPALQAWTRADALTDEAPTNWFGTQNSTLTGYIRVDGTTYRWLGIDEVPAPFLQYIDGDAMTDRPGTDITGSPVKLGNDARPIDCAVLCSLNTQCESWSFIPYNSSQDSCQQSTAVCSLRSAAGTSQSDQCRTSGVPPVHWDSRYVTGTPSTDSPGNDISDFDMAGDATPQDCAERCWATQGCGGFVFAHKDCDDRRDRTHCWVKGVGVNPAGSGDCRQTGLGPDTSGFVPPAWTFSTPAMQQTALRVQPTQTIATFTSDAITLTVTFTQPAFADDQLASSREHVYITMNVSSNDGNKHSVQLYIDAASDLVVSYPSSPNDAVTWADVSQPLGRLKAKTHGYMMKVDGAKPFAFTGDSTRPNWGTLYFAANSPAYLDSTAASVNASRSAFVSNTALPAFDTNMPRVSLGAGANTPVIAFTFDVSVTADDDNSAVAVLFYDEGPTISFFDVPMSPYWSHQYASPIAATVAAILDYDTIKARADAYDADLIDAATYLSNEEYATLLALAHRQVLGASVTVWNEDKQTPWCFIKEMSTGGAMSTVDVLFPGAPLYIAIAPETLKLMLWPIMSWSNNETSDKVTISWAPHDLGGYPIADANAAAQEEMPLEESGNMLLMLAAIAQRQDGDVAWLVPYQKVLEEWAQFINSTLPDPGEQLCTDDFEGPSPHNANLAVKGVVAMNAYAILLRYFGRFEEADTYDTLASQYAEDWKVYALDPQGSPKHYKQRYDQNDTWSDKYNLIFQYMLGTSAFTDDVRTDEGAYYQSQANTFGIPLDNRHSYQKSDWFSWMGSLAFDNADWQNTIIHFLYQFAHTSPDRQPFADLYDTQTNRLPGGFIARFVMGGLWSIPILNAAAMGEWNNNGQAMTQRFPSSRSSSGFLHSSSVVGVK